MAAMHRMQPEKVHTDYLTFNDPLVVVTLSEFTSSITYLLRHEKHSPAATMLTKPTAFQALIASIAVSHPQLSHNHHITMTLSANTPQLLATASSTTTTTPSSDLDVCAIPAFQWHVNAESICCPGVVDMPSGDRSAAYCCVGAHIPPDAVITTTQTSCATKISLNPITEYSSKAREAATKYSVTYTRDVGVGNFTRVETATVGVTKTASGSSEVSTGGAGARKTAAAALVVAGGLLLGI